VTATSLRLGQEAEEPAACRIEGALLGFGLVVGKQETAQKLMARRRSMLGVPSLTN
jgi:hypothetical protein